MNPNTTGKNITTTPTSTIQKSLGITSDNIYGSQTTAAVKAFQTANGLLSDGIFGPKTQAVYNTKFGTGTSSPVPTYGTQAPNAAPGLVNVFDPNTGLPLAGAGTINPNNGQAIVSTGGIHTQAKTNSSALTAALNMNNLPSTVNPTITDPITGAVTTGTNPTPTTPMVTPDPYMDQLNAMSARSNASTKMLISNIQAQKQNQVNVTNKQFENYSKGLQLLGIQQNAAQSSPDLLMGHIKDAENQHMDQINSLNSEEAKALMDAENARADNDFKLLQESMAHYKDIQTQKAQALKDYNDTLMNQPKVAAIAAHDIYDTMNTLDDADKETFLIAVAKKFNLPLASLVTSLTDEKAARDIAIQKAENDANIIEAQEANLKKPIISTTQTTTQINTNKKNDIADAVLTFQDLIKKNNWLGMDPTKYKQVSDSIRKDYGAAAVLELDKAIKTAGIEIDYGDGKIKAKTTKTSTARTS